MPEKILKRSELFVTQNYTDAAVQNLIKGVSKGNIPSFLRLILQNQSVLNAKLDVLMEAELHKLEQRKI